MHWAEVKWEGEIEMFPQDKFEEIEISALNSFLQTVLGGKAGAANAIACFQIESQKRPDMRLMVMRSTSSSV